MKFFFALCFAVAATTVTERDVGRQGVDLKMRTRSFLLAIPKNITKKKEDEIVSKLSVETSKLEKNVVELKKEAKEEQKHAQEKMALRSKMSEKDKKTWDKFDQMERRMNQKSLASARDVLSKLKNAVHFVKKGALRGDNKAHSNLEDLMKQMGEYMS